MLESLVRPYIIKNDMRQNAFFPYLQEIKMPSSAGSLNTWFRKKVSFFKNNSCKVANYKDVQKNSFLFNFKID